MNGNVLLLLPTFVPPLTQALCHGYTINHNIKQLNTLFFYVCANAKPFFSYILMGKSVHT